MELKYTRSGELDFFKNAYEVGSHGRLLFKVYFNAKPEVIAIKTDKNEQIVWPQSLELVGGFIPLRIQATITSNDVVPSSRVREDSGHPVFEGAAEVFGYD
ncbi:unnamed protein product [Hydatigera taeniaeformis]|uniref:Thioredoxin-like_fold domain-containing protein n=1 Tax=Hydatigena taeniaeformis TaxID=6205 RepID=A0A0R3WTT7_HYDTA|nr:unnamed protein product [Hydatigera taeniaeformis]